MNLSLLLVGIPIRTFYDMYKGDYERIQAILANNKDSKGHNRLYGELYGE